MKKELEFDDEKVGVDILYRALAEPLRWIVQNAGADAGWILRKVEESKETDYGFDALTMQFCHMLAAGIVDPAKVTRSALQNAISIGAMVLTTEALVTDIPEKKETPSMPPGGGMGEY